MVESFEDVTQLVRTLVEQIVENPEAATVTGTDQENGELFIEIEVDEGGRVASSRRSVRSRAPRLRKMASVSRSNSPSSPHVLHRIRTCRPRWQGPRA